MGSYSNRIRIICFALSFVFLVQYASAEVMARSRNGMIEFPKYTVGNLLAYSDKDRDDILTIPGYGGATVIPVFPSKFELAVSTTMPEINNIEDYRRMLSSKTFIADKVIEYEVELLACQDLKIRYPTVAGVQTKINRLIAKIDLLVAIYLSLP